MDRCMNGWMDLVYYCWLVTVGLVAWWGFAGVRTRSAEGGFLLDGAAVPGYCNGLMIEGQQLCEYIYPVLSTFNHILSRKLPYNTFTT